MNIPESILMIRSFIFNLVGVFRQGIVIELFNKNKKGNKNNLQKKKHKTIFDRLQFNGQHILVCVRSFMWVVYDLSKSPI